MKANDKTNPALLIDADQYYEVSYTIDQSGKKHLGKQFIKGGDLTEKQIIEIINRVSLADLIN